MLLNIIPDDPQEVLLADLTEYFRLFKAHTSLAQKILLRFHTSNIDEEYLDKCKFSFSNLLKDQEELLKKNVELYTVKFKMVFERFLSRLLEHIQKQQYRSRLKIFQVLQQYYEVAEQIIYETVANAEYLYCLQTLIVKSKIMFEKLIIKTSPIQQKTQNLTILTTSDQPEIKSPVRPVLLHKNSAQFANNNILLKFSSKINEYYSVSNCLDLDYNYLRSTCFYGRSHKDSMFQEMYQRNIMPKEQIQNYRKCYNGFTRRKSRKFNWNAKEHKTVRSPKRQNIQIGRFQSINNPQITLTTNPSPEKQQKVELSSRKQTEITKDPFNTTMKNSFYERQNKFLDANKTAINFKSPILISPKKVLFNFNKLSLKPLEAESRQAYITQRRRHKNTLGTSRKRISDNPQQITIQGYKINDLKKAELIRTLRQEYRFL